MTFRLLVTDGSGSVSEDRRAIETWCTTARCCPASPGRRRFGSAGPGSARGHRHRRPGQRGGHTPAGRPAGDGGHLDLVFGDTSGTVHAIDPETGNELPGWPVMTQAEPDVVGHPGIDPGSQPVIANVAVGDLFHTGQLDVVVATLDGTIDAYNARGQLLPGWPQYATLNVAPCRPFPGPKSPTSACRCTS